MCTRLNPYYWQCLPNTPLAQTPLAVSTSIGALVQAPLISQLSYPHIGPRPTNILPDSGPDDNVDAPAVAAAGPSMAPGSYGDSGSYGYAEAPTGRRLLQTCKTTASAWGQCGGESNCPPGQCQDVAWPTTCCPEAYGNQQVRQGPWRWR